MQAKLSCFHGQMRYIYLCVQCIPVSLRLFLFYAFLEFSLAGHFSAIPYSQFFDLVPGQSNLCIPFARALLVVTKVRFRICNCLVCIRNTYLQPYYFVNNTATQLFFLPLHSKSFSSLVCFSCCQGVTKRCRLSWLTNNALVCEIKCGRMGGGGGFQQMSHGPNNFKDTKP